MADNFNKWYKRKFERLSGDPPDDIWDNIANTLDKEDDRRRRRGFFIRIFSFAGLLFIGSIITINYTFNNKKETLAYNKNVKENLQNVLLTTSLDEKVKSSDHLNKALEATNYRSKSIELFKNENVLYNKKEIFPQKIKKSNRNLKNASILDKSLNKTFAFNHDELNISEVNESNKRTVSRKKNGIKSHNEVVLENNLILKNNASVNLVQIPGADSSISFYSKANLSTAFSKDDTEVYLEKYFTKDSNYQLQDTIIGLEETGKIFMPMAEDSIEEKDTVVIVSQISNADSSISKKSDKIISGGLYIGSTYTINNIWLMNHDTYNGLKSTDFNRTQISFGSAYGILVGYNLSDRFSLQAEWLLNMNQGQKYSVYREGMQYEKTFRLKYTQANLLIKRKNLCLNSNGDLKGTWNKIAGGYVGYLKSATEKTDFYENDIKQNYNSFNYGIILGLEYEAYLNHRWIISSGLMTNIGLKNIYKGTYREPGDFNKTSIFNLGINFGVKYLISHHK